MGVCCVFIPWNPLLRCFVARSYAVMLPAALNVFSMQGFLILNCIIGGQTLASISSHLNDTLGIVIISLIAMVVRPKSICTIVQISG